MSLADDLVALAALAGNTVVAAAATDAWETARDWVGRLFGRGGAKEAERAQERLEDTRNQLVAVADAELDQTRAALAQRWSDRLANLLEEDPDVEADLRALVGQIRARLVSAQDHAVAVGHDMNIHASGGVAVGTAHVSAIAGQGGTAIGRMEYQRPETVKKPVSLGPRPVYLVGREDLLAELDARLATGDGTWPRFITLCGLGGAGKTSIAMEFAHRQVAGVGLAWQFPAEDPSVLSVEFGRLAWPARRPGPGRARGPGGVGACAASGPSRAVAAGVRQCAGPDKCAEVPAASRERAGTDHQPERALAAGSGPERADAGCQGRGGVPDRTHR